MIEILVCVGALLACLWALKWLALAAFAYDFWLGLAFCGAGILAFIGIGHLIDRRDALLRSRADRVRQAQQRGLQYPPDGQTSADAQDNP